MADQINPNFQDTGLEISENINPVVSPTRLQEPEPVMPTVIPDIPDLVSQAFTTSPEDVLKSNASREEKLKAMQELEQQAEAKKNEKVQEQAAKYGQFQQWKAKDDEVAKFNQKAKALGLEPMSRPKFEEFGLNIQDLGSIAETDNAAKLGALSEQQQQAAAEQEAAKQAENAQRIQNAELEGAQRAALKQQQAEQRRLSLAEQQINLEQEKLSEIDPGRFWKNTTTGDKIIAGIAMVLGGIGGALTKTGDNPALKIIMKAIDDDIEAQKISNEQKLKLKQNALRRAELEIQKFEAKSKDENRRAELQLLGQKIAAAQQEAFDKQRQNLLLSKAISGGQGLAPEEATMIGLERPELAHRQIMAENGRVLHAASKDAADKFKTQMADTNSAEEMVGGMIKRIEAAGPLRVQLSPAAFDDVVSGIKGTTEALIGKLRVPITGPGVLTESDYERIKKAIGDPTALFKKPGQGLKQMKELQLLLKLEKQMVYKNTVPGYQIPKEDRFKISAWKNGWDIDKIEKISTQMRQRGDFD